MNAVLLSGASTTADGSPAVGTSVPVLVAVSNTVTDPASGLTITTRALSSVSAMVPDFEACFSTAWGPGGAASTSSPPASGSSLWAGAQAPSASASETVRWGTRDRM